MRLPHCISPHWTSTEATVCSFPCQAGREATCVKYLQADILSTACCFSEIGHQPSSASSYYPTKYFLEAHPALKYAEINGRSSSRLHWLWLQSSQSQPARAPPDSEQVADAELQWARYRGTRFHSVVAVVPWHF